MKNIYLISMFTLREAFSRKIIITFAGISTFVLLLFLAVFLSFDTGILDFKFSTNGMLYSPGYTLAEKIQAFVSIPIFGGTLLLSIFSASGFIPHLLEKGNIDLFLSKPVKRYELLTGKFFGGILMVFLNIAYLVIGLWLLSGIKFGYWNFNFLLTIPVTTFAFSVLYALMILTGVITQSSLLAMMLTYLIYFVLSPVLALREQIAFITGSNFLENFLNTMFYIVPRITELADQNARIAEQLPVENWEAFINCGIFGVVVYGISVYIFNKKDF